MLEIEVRMVKRAPAVYKASAHIALECGSFTISDILLKEVNERVKVTLPLINFGTHQRPCVTLQGSLKKMLYSALFEEYEKIKEGMEQ
ncbi:MAG: hypothetical protein Q4C00_02650 [Bacillota bacterium]|nr:hypothetical protein [Bacillota bacterium]